MSRSKAGKRRLILLVLVLLILIGGASTVYVVRTNRVKKQYAAWRAAGLEAAAKNDHQHAVELLGQYLHRYSDDVDVLVAYAKSRPLVKSPNRAHLRDTMLVLRHLVSLRPDLVEQRRALLRMYSEYGYAAEAVANADALIAKAGKDPELLGIRAMALGRMRRYNEAIQAAAQWAEVAPAEIDAPLLSIELLKAAARPSAETDQLLAKCDERFSDPAAKEMLRAVALAGKGSSNEAAQLLRTAAGRKTSDLKVRRRIIGSFDMLGMHEESLAMLQQLVEDVGDTGERRLLVRRFWELGKWDEVIKQANLLGDSELKDDTELRAMTAFAMARSGKAETARAAATALRSNPRDLQALAWAEIIETAVSGASVDSAKWIKACDAALKEVPSDTLLRYFLGEAYSSAGEPEAAIAQFQRVAGGAITWPLPATRLSETFMRVGRVQQAFEAALIAFRRSPAFGAVPLATAWNACIEGGVRNDDASFRQLLDDIEKAAPDTYLVFPERISALCRDGKKEEAKKAIGDVFAGGKPPVANVLLRLAATSQRYGLGLENQCYQALETQKGPSADFALSRALSLFLAGKKPEAIEHFNAVRKLASNPQDVDWMLADARLLDVLREPGALDAWKTLAKTQPQNLRVQQAVLSARSARTDRPLMDETIERVKTLSGGEGVSWRVARARWFLEGGTDAKSAERAGELLAASLLLAPDSVEARMLHAKALERMGNTAGAVDQLTTVAKLNPSLQIASLYLAQLLQARGDFARARDYLEQATRGGTDDANRNLAAHLLAQQGDPKEAIKLLEEASDLGDEADILLVTLYRQQNDPRTEELLNKLLKKPTLPAIAIAVDYYGSKGKHDQALQVMDLVKTVGAEPGREELLRAEYASRYQKMEQAIEYARSACKLAPSNPVAWRALMTYCVSAGRIPDALAALDEGSKAAPADPQLRTLRESRDLLAGSGENAALQVFATALVRNPDMTGTKEAMQVLRSREVEKQLSRLKTLSDQHTRNLILQVYTAERLLSAARYEEAASIASRAAQSFPLSADAAQFAATSLLAAKRWTEALKFADSWKSRIGAAALDADVTAARALIKLGDPTAARDRLAPYMAQSSLDRSENAGKIALYAAALQLAGQKDEAEKLLLPLLRQSEKVRLAWIARVTEDLPPVEATEWIGRVLAVVPTDSLEGQLTISGAAGSLAKESGDQKLMQVARQIRATAAQQKDLPLGAVIMLGMQAEMDNDFAMAETMYRRALAGGNFPVIKNNLAMVLTHLGGDLSEAETLATDAVKMDPTRPTYHDTLSFVKGARGDLAGAIASARNCIQLDPENPQWQMRLVESLLNAGQEKEGLQVFASLEASAAKLDKSGLAQLEKLRRRIKAMGTAAVLPVSR